MSKDTGLKLSRVDQKFLLPLLSALLINLSLNLSLNGAWAHGETFVGKAVNSKGDLEYLEHHVIKYSDGKVSESQTVYYDAENNKIGDLISDYSKDPRFGSYEFRDIRARYEDGAKVTDEGLLLFRRESPEEDKEVEYLSKEADQIVGQGVHHFISNNLERIAQGEIIHVKMVLPSQLDQYDFRIRKRKVEGDTLFIRLEVDNWFLRLFAPHLDCAYDLRTRRLLRYEGISNLADTSGKHGDVSITYFYESDSPGPIRQAEELG